MRRKTSPARLRYEAARPTVTARIPAEVKARLDAVLQPEGVTFSAWVEAQAVGAAAQHDQTEAAARAAGYREGLARAARRAADPHAADAQAHGEGKRRTRRAGFGRQPLQHCAQIGRVARVPDKLAEGPLDHVHAGHQAKQRGQKQGRQTWFQVLSRDRQHPHGQDDEGRGRDCRRQVLPRLAEFQSVPLGGILRLRPARQRRSNSGRRPHSRTSAAAALPVSRLAG